MVQFFTWLVNTKALDLIVVVTGFLAVARIVSPARAFMIILLLILFGALGPFLDQVIAVCPFWVVTIFYIVSAIIIIYLIFGRRVTENVLAMILYNLLAIPVQLLGRLIWVGRRLLP